MKYKKNMVQSRQDGIRRVKYENYIYIEEKVSTDYK